MAGPPVGFVPDGFVPDAPAPPIGAHPEARMSAADNSVPGLAWSADPNGVTLQDLRDHPVEAMHQIGANVKQEASDPRTWLALAAAYFGPKAYPLAKPLILRAANSPAVRIAAARALTAGAAGAGAYVGGPGGAVAGTALGELVGGFIRPSAAAAAPEVVSAPGYPRGGTTTAPPIGETPPAAAPAVDEFTVARSARSNALPDQKALNEAAIAARQAAYQARQAAAANPDAIVPASGKQHFTAPEWAAFRELRARGLGLEEAATGARAAGQLARQLGGATDAEVAAAVKHRGVTGKW